MATLAVAVVLGILGMHELGPHRMPQADMPAGMTMPAADHAPAQSAGPVARPGGQHGTADMLMLCMAMLAAAGVLLLSWLRGRGVPTRERVRRLGRQLSAPLAGAVAGAGPPHVWRFSVIRC